MGFLIARLVPSELEAMVVDPEPPELMVLEPDPPVPLVPMVVELPAFMPVPELPLGAVLMPDPVLAGLVGRGLVFAGFGVEPVLLAPGPPGAGACAIGAVHHRPARTAVSAMIFERCFMRVSG